MNGEDEEIRSRLHRELFDLPPVSVTEAYAQLKPRLRRARRRRRTAIGATGFVLIGTAGTGVGIALNARSTSTVRSYGANDSHPAVEGRVADPADDLDGEPSVRVPRPDATASSTSATAPTTSTSASVPTSPGIGVPAASIPGPSTVAATEPPETDGEEIPVTEPAPVTATEPVSTSHLIDSECGTVTVVTTGDRIELTEVAPDAGFESDVEEDGPGEVKVTLRGENGECKIAADVDGGQLDVEVDGPEDDPDGTDGPDPSDGDRD